MGTILICLFLLTLASFSYAQVYRWVDQDGVTHYTDNLQNIPEKYRKSVRESTLPEITTYRDVGSTGTPSKLKSDTEQEVPQDSEAGIYQLKEAIDTLRSQIKAKKDLIKYVDDRRNLAINPYRNRIITEKELELYDRYKEELPENERELENLESTLKMFEEQ